MRTYNICLECEKPFNVKIWLKDVKKFCSKQCYTSFQTGKTLPEETKQKISESNKGRRITEKTREKIRNMLKGKKFSLERRKNISNSMLGEKNHNWTGGSKLGIQIRNLYKYITWRYKIFKRDNFTCQLCNNKFCKLNAHHITSFSDIIKENNIKTIKDAEKCSLLWDENNGMTVCKECHKKIHFGDKN